MNRKSFIPFVIIVTIIFFLLLLGSFYSTVWTQNSRKSNSRMLADLSSGWSIRDDATSAQEGIITVRKVFYFDEFLELVHSNIGEVQDLPAQGDKYISSPSLFFITHNQKVRVYMDHGHGEFLIYSFGTEGKRFVGAEAGTAVHIVRLPYKDENPFIVSIEFSPSFSTNSIEFDHNLYKLFPTHVPKILFGFGMQTVNHLVWHTWYQWVPVIIILIVAFVLFFEFISFLLCTKKNNSRIMYMAHFALFMGVGFLNDCYVGCYLFGSSFSSYFVSTVTLSIVPFMLVLFIQTRKTFTHSEQVSDVIKALSLVNLCAVFFFAVLPVVPFSVLRLYLVIVLFVSVVILTSFLIHEIITERSALDISDIVILVSVACLLVDLVLGVVNWPDGELFEFSRWGMMLFFIMFSSLITQEYFLGEISNAKRSMLKQATTVDMLTGCVLGANMWNEERFFKENEEKYGVLIIMVPSYIKIQREKGLSECENVLRLIAQLLKSLFPSTDIYKFADSKFAVYIPASRYEHINTDIAYIESGVRDFNTNDSEIEVDVVFAHSLMDDKRDHDFDGLFTRLISEVRMKAEEKMHRNLNQPGLFE